MTKKKPSIDSQLEHALRAMRRMIASGRRDAADAIACMYGCSSADKLVATIEHNLNHIGGSEED